MNQRGRPISDLNLQVLLKYDIILKEVSSSFGNHLSRAVKARETIKVKRVLYWVRAVKV